MEYKVSTQIQVRFSDLDPLGHVNNANYFTYFEEGRVAYFKKFKNIKFIGNPEQSFILAHISCDFKSPATIGETLIVSLRIKEIKNSSFSMEYLIEDMDSGRIVATGESIQVCFDYKNNRKISISKEMRKRFEDIEGRSL